MSAPVSVSSLGIVAVVVALTGCGAANPTGTVAPPPEPPPGCDTLLLAIEADERTDLLEGRLTVTLPADAERSRRAGAPPVEERYTLAHDAPMELVVTELFRTGTDDLEGAAASAIRQAGGDVGSAEAVAAAGPGGAAIVFPSSAAVDPPVAHGFVVTSDRTVVHLGFHPRPGAGPTGCEPFVRAVVESARPGARRLELSGGAHDLVAGLRVDVPAGHVLRQRPARPDSSQVYDILPVVPLGASAAQLGIYVGEHPRTHATDVTLLRQVEGTLFGQPVRYLAWTEGGGRGTPRVHLREHIQELPSGGLFVHVSVRAVDDESADALLTVAGSLREE